MESWHDFYLMLGPSAAALIGLLFVVATLTSGLEQERTTRGTRVYSTPTVFHLAVVVFLSGLGLEPDLPAVVVQIAVFACSVAGLAYAVYISRALKSGKLETYEIDFWCYGVGVGVLYAAMAAAGVMFTAAPRWAPYFLGGDLLILLLLLVHNSWDLVTWMAPRAEQKDP